MSRLEEEAWPGATEPVAVSTRSHGPPSHPRYEILDVLGRGGAGVVYRALDRELGLEVALKSLRAEGPAAADKLKSEFRLRADIHHPHLLPLYDLVITDAVAFFTMELVAGPSALAWMWGEAAAELGCRDAVSVARMASAARQLVSALAALHHGGLIHCDVKPDNLLVRGDHLLLGDFGLAARIASGVSARADIEGTPAYMAPERKRGAAPTSASDMYSVGALLVECLTGSAPPRAFRDHAAVPVDPRLLDLIDALLAPVPAERPTARAALQLLDAIVPEPSIPVPTESLRTLGQSTSFVGREDALTTAFHAFKGSDREGSRIVGVIGPSGIGKTTFAERALGRTPRSTVQLAGRCHPHEQVAFGVWQDVIERLAAEIRRAGHSPLTGLGADESAALGRVFPALASSGRSSDDLVIAEGDLRRLAFAALKNVFSAFAHEQRMIVWLDDLQWADDDCVELLDSLLAGNGIPRCDFLLSHRPLEKEGDRVAELLTRLGARVISIKLEPLSRSETKEILRQEIHRAGESATETRIEKLAESSNGFPIFAQVLARRESSHQAFTLPPGEGGDDLLSRLINDGVDGLASDERKLVDTVSLAEGPMSLQVAAMASSLADRALSALVATEQMALLSRAPGSDVLRIVPYHDRVRQARIARLGPEATARTHRALVAAHEALHTEEYEALAHHSEATGDRDRATRYAEMAGDRAATALGFAAAAAFYSRALKSTTDVDRSGTLERKLADSFGAQGLGALAATAYERAATSFSRDADRIKAMNLKNSAAEQFFHSGLFEDGYRMIRDVLDQLGTKLPTSYAACIAHSVALRARFVIRGHSFEPAREEDIPESERARLDALWTASTSLAHVNHALSDGLMLRHMLGALAAGEPSRILKSLTFCATAEAAIGGSYFDKRSDRMFAEADRIVRNVGGTYNLAWTQIASASTRYFRADWPGVIRSAARAEELLQQHRFRITWERSINYLYWNVALALTGQVDELERRREIAFSDALARRDPLAQNHCSASHPGLLWLYKDDVEKARLELESVKNIERIEASASPREGQWPEGTYSTLDYHNLIAAAHVDLYEGRALDAYKRMMTMWPWLKSSQLLRVQFTGADLRYLLARSALAAKGEDRKVLDKIARRELGALRGEKQPIAQAYASLLTGVLEARTGSQKAARDAFASAKDLFDALSMPIHSAAASLRGEEVSRPSASDQPLEALRSLGIGAPEKVVDLFVPRL